MAWLSSLAFGETKKPPPYLRGGMSNGVLRRVKRPIGCGPSTEDILKKWAREFSDIVSKLLRLEGNGVELGAHTREQIGRRRPLSRIACCGGAEQRRGKEVRQKGGAGQRD